MITWNIKNLVVPNSRFVRLIISVIFFLNASPIPVNATIEITSVKAGNNQEDKPFIEVLTADEEIVKLSYDENYLIFEISHNIDDSSSLIQYRMQGLDYNWVDCKNCKQIQYAHLDGGEYSFLIRSSSAPDEIERFNFIIEGNILHKWWFVPMLFLYFIVILGFVLYFFTLYRFRLKMREQQLVHSEKLTAMVDLTSGVAHEIQNPLNFVNNFSELSLELLEETNEELHQVELHESSSSHLANINELIGYLMVNMKKIKKHGASASSIIRGMMEHSKPGASLKEPTDLNNFVKKVLQNTLEIFEQKVEKFDHQIVANYHPNLPHTKIVKHNMFKALSNLTNNALYSIYQKSKVDQENFVPKIIVTTYRDKNKIIIEIKDNGVGIPKSIQNKILQPFFTTKKAGQGTGLGLSLAYDIITGGHGGSLTFESEEEIGATFKVILPIL